MTVSIDYEKMGRIGRIKYFSVTAWLFNTLVVVTVNTCLQDLYISSRLFTGLTSRNSEGNFTPVTRCLLYRNGI